MLLSSLILRSISWAWKKSSFPTASSTRLRHASSLGLSSKMSQPTPTGCRKGREEQWGVGQALLHQDNGYQKCTRKYRQEKKKKWRRAHRAVLGRREMSSGQVYLSGRNSQYFKGHLQVSSWPQEQLFWAAEMMTTYCEWFSATALKTRWADSSRDNCAIHSMICY